MIFRFLNCHLALLIILCPFEGLRNQFFILKLCACRWGEKYKIRRTPKNLVKRLKGLEIGERIKTVKAITLLGLAKIYWRVLENMSRLLVIGTSRENHQLLGMWKNSRRRRRSCQQVDFTVPTDHGEYKRKRKTEQMPVSCQRSKESMEYKGDSEN